METAGDDVAERMSAAGLTIYDQLADRPDLVYAISTLEARLDTLLVGLDLNFAIRTRAKVAKQKVAEALGYPSPTSFRKTRPRFPGQDMDVSVQLANNFQVWNEPLDPLRRYVLIRVDAGGVVTKVRVLTGEAIALYDKTGTYTSKYQAKRRSGFAGSKLVSIADTDRFVAALAPVPDVSPEELSKMSPSGRPRPGVVLPIGTIYSQLLKLVGTEFDDPGIVQDRNRGTLVQKLVSEVLGLGPFADGGQFPDILSQVLEVKLQLSPTIDLGLVSPDSDAPIQEANTSLRHRDARYAVVYGKRVEPTRVRLDSVILSTGADFFGEFQRFEGLIQNKKLQIPLPSSLFQLE